MRTGFERAARQLDRCRRRAPHTFLLARLASLAVRVEPFLLRTLRQELLPDVDVGVEADVWFSSLVESRGADAVVLNSNVVALLRQDLANDRALLRRALDITRKVHRHSPPSLQLEEAVNGVALLNEGDVVATINEALRPALRSIRLGGDQARDVAQWAMRALPRFDPTVRWSESALSLLLAASAVLGGRRLVKEVPEIRIPIARIGWALPEQALFERISLGVELLERGVRFARPGSNQPAIELPRTDPLIVELEWSRNGERIKLLVEAKEGRTIDLEDDLSDLTLRTLAGDEYEIARVATTAEPNYFGPQKAERGSCFVIMGFGKKTDFETAHTLDLDKSYRNIIKPSAEAAGLKCVRADEIAHTGWIALPMYDQLLKADVVVADLSTSNIHALYQLGVRHALRPYTTVVISEDRLKTFPFDENVVPVRKYQHLGEDIAYEEVVRFRALLTEVIQKALEKPEVDSPLYKSLTDLLPPRLNQSMS
jgi:hypothetical protein